MNISLLSRFFTPLLKLAKIGQERHFHQNHKWHITFKVFFTESNQKCIPWLLKKVPTSQVLWNWNPTSPFDSVWKNTWKSWPICNFGENVDFAQFFGPFWASSQRLLFLNTSSKGKLYFISQVLPSSHSTMINSRVAIMWPKASVTEINWILS